MEKKIPLDVISSLEIFKKVEGNIGKEDNVGGH